MSTASRVPLIEDLVTTGLKIVRDAVVTLNICCSVDFESPAGVRSATGFRIGEKYIATNRHVIGSGPVLGFCVFVQSNETAEIVDYWADPIHDFAILTVKCDPRAGRYMTMPPIELRPDLVRVDLPICVLGNDGGAVSATRTSTISGVTLGCPKGDMNFPYYQMSTGNTNGSSGSPVIDYNGNVVAILSGGFTNSMNSISIPVDRLKRALECIEADVPIPRGDIQCEFIFRTVSVCRDLGLTEAFEEEIRKDCNTFEGLPVVAKVLREGYACEKIKVGDILLQMEGKWMNDMSLLDDTWDSKVGETVCLMLLRKGDRISLDIPVQDLYQVTPDRFLRVAGNCFHMLSYHLALDNFLPHKRISTWVDGEQVVLETIEQMDVSNWDLEKLGKEMLRFCLGDIPQYEYRCLDNLTNIRNGIISIGDQTGPEITLAVREPTEMFRWTRTTIGSLGARRLNSTEKSAPDTHTTSSELSIGKIIVNVACESPVPVDDIDDLRIEVMGIILDSKSGLLFVPGKLASSKLCKIMVTVGGSERVAASIVFVHPYFFFSIAKYEPSSIKQPIQGVKLSRDKLQRGDKGEFWGYRDCRLFNFETTVSCISPVISDDHPTSTQDRGINLDGAEFIAVDYRYRFGVFINLKGELQAFWYYYYGVDERWAHGLESHLVDDIVCQLQRNEDPQVQLLPAKFNPVSLADAKQMGVPATWAEQLSFRSGNPHVFRVMNVVSCPDQRGDNVLEVGDLLLSIIVDFGGTKPRQKISLSEITLLSNVISQLEVETEIVRRGELKVLYIKTVPAGDLVTQRVLQFCGAIIQTPPLSALLEAETVPSSIYVSDLSTPSTLLLYSFSSDNPISRTFITEIDGQEVTDMDSFFSSVLHKSGKIQIRTISLTGRESIFSFVNNDAFIPTRWFS